MQAAASAVLVESIIADCEARGDLRGGGIFVDQANITLRGGSRIARCLASYGGGLGANDADVAMLEGSILSECHAIKRGGGMRVRLVAHMHIHAPPHPPPRRSHRAAEATYASTESTSVEQAHLAS